MPFSLICLRDQVLSGYFQFFLIDVAGEFDDLHPVPESRQNGVAHVCRGDEHDLGKVKGHVQIVIAEGMILLRVKDFQQCGRRVSAEIGSDLVNFVKHEYGVVGPGILEPLNDTALEERRYRYVGGREFPPRPSRLPAISA